MAKTALITGANRGMGYESAKQLLAKNYKVYLGVRDPQKQGEKVEELDGEATWLTIDVAKAESIKSAADWLADNEKHLNVLINNAGIYPDCGKTILDIDQAQLGETLQTNTFGPILVSQQFVRMLKKGSDPRIVNVSSGYGQLGGLAPDVPSYCLSKLALNGVTKMLAEFLSDDGISVNSVCPGWVRTEMGGENAPRSVAEGAAGIVWVADEAPQELSGKFFRDGEEISW